MNQPRIGIINAPGIAYGPGVANSSELFSGVNDAAQKQAVEIAEAVSTDVIKFQGVEIGLQLPLSMQFQRIRDRAEAMKNGGIERVVVFAHSAGALAAMSSLIDPETNVDRVVAVSPTILQPHAETLGHSRFVGAVDEHNILTAAHIPFPTLMGDDFLRELAAHEGYFAAAQQQIQRGDLRLFVGENDWNAVAERYHRDLDATVVMGEGHSFKDASDEVFDAIANELLEDVPVPIMSTV